LEFLKYDPIFYLFFNLVPLRLKIIKANTVQLAELHHSSHKSADNILPCKMMDALVDSMARTVNPNYPPCKELRGDKNLCPDLVHRHQRMGSHNIPASRIPFRKNDDLLA
jgi:hypothetical protein